MDAVKYVITLYGRLDILVNGAAGNFLCSAEDLSPNAFKTGKSRLHTDTPLT
jgi:peroxisomal 2,4-dienoyl-CoA reductase